MLNTLPTAHLYSILKINIELYFQPLDIERTTHNIEYSVL